MKESGIYMIANKESNKCYVGSAINLYKRFIQHRTMLKRGIHKNRHLQVSFDKYGLKGFNFIVLVLVEKDRLLIAEKYYMDMLQAHDRRCGYNICLEASNSLGVKRSEETKEKVRQANIGKKWPPRSEEHRKKMREIMKGNTNGRFRKGIKMSDEAKQKMSLAKKGKPASEAMHLALKGKPWSIARREAHNNRKIKEVLQ